MSPWRRRAAAPSVPFGRGLTEIPRPPPHNSRISRPAAATTSAAVFGCTQVPLARPGPAAPAGAPCCPMPAPAPAGCIGTAAIWCTNGSDERAQLVVQALSPALLLQLMSTTVEPV